MERKPFYLVVCGRLDKYYKSLLNAHGDTQDESIIGAKFSSICSYAKNVRFSADELAFLLDFVKDFLQLALFTTKHKSSNVSLIIEELQLLVDFKTKHRDGGISFTLVAIDSLRGVIAEFKEIYDKIQGLRDGIPHLKSLLPSEALVDRHKLSGKLKEIELINVVTLIKDTDFSADDIEALLHVVKEDFASQNFVDKVMRRKTILPLVRNLTQRLKP